MMEKKVLAFLIVMLVATFLAFSCAPAAEYPAHPIELVIPFRAGGGHDMNTRAIIAVAEQYVGQPLIPVIQEGGGSAIGHQYLLSKPNDGYATLAGAPHSFLAKAMETQEVPYDLEDFRAIGLISNDPTIYTMRADAPWQSLPEVVAQLKKEPESVKAGVVGGFQLVALGVIEAQDNVRFNKPVLAGGGESIPMMLGGHLDMGAGHIAPSYTHIVEGTIRVMAVATEERISDPELCEAIPYLADVPTMIELGYDFTQTMWVPWWVRADTPDDIVQKLEEAYWAIMDDASYKQLTVRMGLNPARTGAAETDAYIKADYARTKVICDRMKAAGLFE